MTVSEIRKNKNVRVCLFICVCVYLLICLLVCLFTCLLMCLFVCLCACLFACIVLGNGHPDTVAAASTLARVQDARGRPDKAKVEAMRLVLHPHAGPRCCPDPCGRLRGATDSEPQARKDPRHLGPYTPSSQPEAFCLSFVAVCCLCFSSSVMNEFRNLTW